MSTLTTIRDIFYSGGHAFTGNIDTINEIAFLVDEGYMTYQKTTIADKKEFLDLLKEHGQLKKMDEATGGGYSHVALKILTGNYLKQRQYAVEYEHPFCGYFPDVITTDKTIVAECGHTQNPEKILTYFKQGKIKECIQIPYPNEEDTMVIGYCFVAGNSLSEFLDFLEAEKRNELRRFIHLQFAAFVNPAVIACDSLVKNILFSTFICFAPGHQG